jgi:hypothetical protein
MAWNGPPSKLNTEAGRVERIRAAVPKNRLLLAHRQQRGKNSEAKEVAKVMVLLLMSASH